MTGAGSGGSIGITMKTVLAVTKTAPVAVGQVWRDNDKRVAANRAVHVDRIDGDYAQCTVGRLQPGGAFVAANRKAHIRLSRFRPTSTGYVLVHVASKTP